VNKNRNRGGKNHKKSTLVLKYPLGISPVKKKREGTPRKVMQRKKRKKIIGTPDFSGKKNRPPHTKNSGSHGVWGKKTNTITWGGVLRDTPA